MRDSRIFNEQREVIYGGRGARSKRCREMIVQGLAYAMNNEGELVWMEPPQDEQTITESAEKIRDAAEELADTLGVDVTGYEVRMDVGDKTFIAELGLPDVRVVNGLSIDQIAEMANTYVGWMVRRGLRFHEYQELIEKVHRMLAKHQLPTGALQGMHFNIHDEQANRESLAVNMIPGNATTRVCYEELWIVPGMMPLGHVCRPHSDGIEEVHRDDLNPIEYGQDMNHCRELWEGDAAHVGNTFLCENLEHAAHSRCLRRGGNKVVRIFLHFDDYESQDIQPPIYDCLERFIGYCSELKRSGDNPELRLIVHRGLEAGEEVIL
jgi:hypothetical protein